MDCLKGFIGISQSCPGTPVSKSGMYIEDLEGISLKSISNIEGGKYVTAQALVDAKLRVVGNKLIDILSELIQDISVNTAADGLISKSFGDRFFDAQPGTPGLIIEKYPTAFSSLYLTNIYFKSETAVQNLSLLISDGVNSETVTVTASAGEEVEIPVNFSSKQNRITITYTSASGPSDNLVAPHTQDISCYSVFELRAICHGDCGHRYIRVFGQDFSGNKSSNYYGVRADVHLICDREKMVCLLIHQYKTAVLYMLGAEISREWVASDRFNFLAMNSKEWAQGKAQEWEQKAIGVFAANSDGIRNLLLHTEKKCFNCNTYQYHEPVP